MCLQQPVTDYNQVCQYSHVKSNYSKFAEEILRRYTANLQKTKSLFQKVMTESIAHRIVALAIVV